MSEQDADIQSKDRFAEVFQGRTLLITGGTGFVGKVFIEKILRVCDVKRIYALVRTKKGKDPKERLQTLINDPLFDLAKKIKGEAELQKIKFIAGDVSQPDLGLSEANRKILTDETEMIFHCAATIRFDEDLKPAVLLNVRGTKLILQLAHECKKLFIFSHLSTAYCHLKERILYEKAYPPPADPESIIKMCEILENDVVNLVAPKILEDMPNSYAFTKGLSESLVVDEIGKLPIIVLRPSIIMPILEEPIPGWTDNLNGPMGLLIAGGKGVLRTMHCNGEAYADYVPVDIVVNSMIGTVGDYMVFKAARHIYNITSSAEYKITFQEIIDYGRNTVYTRLPFNGVFWYPGGSVTQSRLRFRLEFFFYQWVPAVIIDILLVCLGYPPVLKKVQNRIWKGYDVFSYYANRQWDFDNDASLKARNLLTKKEKSIYRFYGDDIKYEQYFYDCIHCARLYILKESDDTIPAAKRHMTIMYFVDRISKTLIILGFFYLIWKYILLPIFGF